MGAQNGKVNKEATEILKQKTAATVAELQSSAKLKIQSIQSDAGRQIEEMKQHALRASAEAEEATIEAKKQVKLAQREEKVLKDELDQFKAKVRNDQTAAML